VSRFGCASSATLGLVALGVFFWFWIIDAEVSDWAQLVGSIMGGAVGSIALMYAARYTILEQRRDQDERRDQKHKKLLTAIWAEIRIACEIERLIVERIGTFLAGLEMAGDAIDPSAIRQLKPFEAVRLSLLRSNLSKLGEFDSDIQDCLIHLDFEAKMRESAWEIDGNEIALDGNAGLLNLRDWSVRTLVRLLIARNSLARKLGRDDVLYVGEGMRPLISGENLEVLKRKLVGVANIDEIFTGIAI
jgi:hypothetical protein